MKTAVFLLITTVGIVTAAARVSGSPSGSDYVTRLWATTTFPEAARPFKHADFAVAFSGGGTRSAAATIGQLRALRELGWLPKVGYISAVSGGSWAAVPFTFTDGSVDDNLLGRQPPFEALTPQQLAIARPGSLAGAVADSKLATCAAVETSRILDLLPSNVVQLFARATGRCEFGEADAGTYSRLLSSVFLRNTTNIGATSLMAWDERQVDEALEVNPSLTRSRFAVTGDQRPFLIANATVIRDTPDGRELTPIEMTPYYTGVRRHHSSIGGTYIWSWAFDSEGPITVYPGNEFIRIRGGAQHHGLTPADMMASSGAAPLLWIVSHLPSAITDVATAYFPHFTHFTLYDSRPERAQRSLLHGDGGFVDNVGLMPLLARRVQNIIAFVNTKDPLIGNDDISSYFHLPGGSGDNGAKVHNVVFERGEHGEDHYEEVVNGLTQQVSAGRGAVYCGTNWRVRANETYGIEPYTGVNICFVYNYHAYDWWKQLPESLLTHVAPPRTTYFTGAEVSPKGEGDFKDFPWYRTFFENGVTVVDLKPAQVNLLAHLSYWTLTNQQEMIKGALPVTRE